jgi:hypothetical protein
MVLSETFSTTATPPRGPHKTVTRVTPLTDEGVSSVATHYDKLTANYLAFVQLASIRLRLRAKVHALG